MCNDITENVRLVEAVPEGGVKPDGANRSARLEATIWAGFLEQDCSTCFPVRATKIRAEPGNFVGSNRLAHHPCAPTMRSFVVPVKYTYNDGDYYLSCQLFVANSGYPNRLYLSVPFF